MRPIDIAAPFASLMAPGSEIGPLHLARVVWAADVAIVELAHCGQVLQRADLVSSSRMRIPSSVGHVVDLGAFHLLGCDQALHAVERNPAIVADDAPRP